MTNLRRVLKEDIKQMVAAEVKDVTQTLRDEFTATTDFLGAEQHDLKASIAEQDKKIKQLESEKVNLVSQVTVLSSRLASVENISRSRNLEIQAVPESRSENVLLLLKSLCQVINSPILESDIHACRRVAKFNTSSERPRNILVTLSSPRLRDNLISAVHRYNKSHPNDLLNSNHLGLTGETRRIFVSEHLSPEVKQLHAAARKRATELGFKYVWVRYNRVYMRKDDGSSALHVKNMDTLAKLS
ncbi:uncharacterized protein LOC125225975 [Leguminivora glycinivorella]|uniref:uncharacterized protein LOC125225975 n=1 Tax=Leguminivora glycinivorella TaxID=1035111 RepID=UPI00200F857B|nr:uncharacterized protein LOC125225975 [Leguminivora glycinivorella]